MSCSPCVSFIKHIHACGQRTIRQYNEWVGLAEGAFGADVQVDGGETEVVPSIIQLCFGQVQVTCDL